MNLFKALNFSATGKSCDKVLFVDSAVKSIVELSGFLDIFEDFAFKTGIVEANVVKVFDTVLF